MELESTSTILYHTCLALQLAPCSIAQTRYNSQTLELHDLDDPQGMYTKYKKMYRTISQ